MSPSKRLWQNKSRILRGRRKGAFAKEKVVKQMENAQAALSNKRLCEAINSDNKNNQWFKNCSNILDGRRIVELLLLAKELWCNNCDLPLSLRHATSESLCGLSSVITVRCTKCNADVFIHTNKKMPNDTVNLDGHTYSVNLKAAMGIIDAGMGETHVNTFLSALNIPVVNPPVVKRHERIIGKATESVAESSCRDAIRLEKELTLQKEIITDSTCDTTDEVRQQGKKTALKFSFDCGWQKRGTGRSYNSLSDYKNYLACLINTSNHGQAMLIGYYSGKVASYAVRSKQCRSCQLGHSKADHDCRANFNGSAKSMEPDMAVELFTQNKLLEETNAYASVIIGDDDSSTVAAVRRNATHEITKLSDYNHSFKAFTSGLWEMKLTDNLKEYFSRSFSIAVKTNKDDADAVRAALQAIVPHAFGDHEQCGEWCNGRVLKENYIHSNLPGGKPLQDQKIKQKLTDLLSRFIKAADKIAPCASTQANESMNNLVCSKNPKARHYSASESFNYRVAASVCQKNIGYQYITSVYKKLSLSPGKRTQVHRLRKDRKKELQSKLSKTKEIKRKRLFRKKMRSSTSARKQQQEGVTYETGILLNNNISEQTTNNLKEINLKELDNLTNYGVVYFDLETTGLKHEDQICQIAASKSISKSASEKTGMQIIDGEMFVHGARVSTIPSRGAIEKFLQYLEEIKKKNTTRNETYNIILVAHNGFQFDVPRILSLIFRVGLMENFHSVVFGFADSLRILKSQLLERKSNKLSFSVESLVKDFFPNENLDNLHNALDDVIFLKKIIDHCLIPNSVIKENSKSVHTITTEQQNKQIIILNKNSLKCYEGRITDNLIKKIAEAGISKNILEAAFSNNGHNGLRFLLQESVNGKARVKLTKKALEQVIALFPVQ